MGRIDVEEPAAVRAELLDRDLRSSGAERYDLLFHLRLLRHRIALFILDRVALGIELRGIVGDGLGERHGLVFAEGLHNSLRDEQQRLNQRKRHQDVKRRAGEIEPEVTDGLCRVPA